MPSDSENLLSITGVNFEVLDISSNNLVNNDLADIARITSLKALTIRDCGLNASELLEGTYEEMLSFIIIGNCKLLLKRYK